LHSFFAEVTSFSGAFTLVVMVMIVVIAGCPDRGPNSCAGSPSDESARNATAEGRAKNGSSGPSDQCSATGANTAVVVMAIVVVVIVMVVVAAVVGAAVRPAMTALAHTPIEIIVIVIVTVMMLRRRRDRGCQQDHR
jgi:hypothetical protein